MTVRIAAVNSPAALRVSAVGLRSRKLRAALSALGILIWIASLVAGVSEIRCICLLA